MENEKSSTRDAELIENLKSQVCLLSARRNPSVAKSSSTIAMRIEEDPDFDTLLDYNRQLK